MSSAEGVASLLMLGYRNLVTKAGHHAPGYYMNGLSPEDIGSGVTRLIARIAR